MKTETYREALNARTTMNGKPVFRVPVKSVINMDSGFAPKLLCDGPTLAMGDACAYRCAFCYVPSMVFRMDRVQQVLKDSGLKHEDVVIIRDAALDVLRSQLVDSKGRPKHKNDNDRRVIYSSPLDDVAANMDLVRATVEACTLILQHTNWHIRLLSKSTLLPKLAKMLEERGGWGGPFGSQDVRQRMIFGVSTGTLDDAIAAAFEEGTPKVSKRIESLHELQDSGYRTYAMVCPSLPMEGWKRYREFAFEAQKALHYHRCEHVWAEVINLRGESFTRTYQALKDAGHERLAVLTSIVSSDRVEWEKYNRETFLAHAEACPPEKLRFLTYIKPETKEWWQQQVSRGAVLLGKEAHA